MTLIIHLAFVLLLTATPAAAQNTYIVNSNGTTGDANPGDGICDTGSWLNYCTLNAAIDESNADGTPSIIKFSTRFQSTNSFDGCSLPALTEGNTSLDASEWWDTQHDRPGVEITGGACTMLSINSSDNNILGLLYGGGGNNTGILVVTGSNNKIGGLNTGQRNVFAVEGYGVQVQSSGTTYITNNYFGTIDGINIPGSGDYFGTRGIYVEYSGTANISNNLIVGQSEAGILLWASNNIIHDNIIGLDNYKSASLPNKTGIIIYYGNQNLIGNNNVIAGNSSDGVELNHSDNNSILNNDIGYFWDHTVDLSNGANGIHVHVSDNTVIGQVNQGNKISYNAGNGIYVNTSQGTSIQGNELYDNGDDAIHFNDSNGQIGGSVKGENNSILYNKGDGIHLRKSYNVSVLGNYIGHNGNSGTGNREHGILVDGGSQNNSIGGEKLGEGNWIGLNSKDGIRISGSTTHDNYVSGNILGAAISATWKLPNGNHGISIYDGAYNNTIGGIDGGNIILDSGWSGMVIVNSSNNSVVANRIGTDGAGKNWGNSYYGVHVVGNSSGNGIVFNQIAYNGTHNGLDSGEAGILIDGAWGNIISENSIHDNDGPGIKLTNGGNINLPAPSITSASCVGPVSGTTGGPGWVVEIFSDNSDEGRFFEGKVFADSMGNWSWNGRLNGPKITATARAQSNDTSPFSTPFNIGSCFFWPMFLPAITGAQ